MSTKCQQRLYRKVSLLTKPALWDTLSLAQALQEPQRQKADGIYSTYLIPKATTIEGDIAVNLNVVHRRRK